MAFIIHHSSPHHSSRLCRWTSPATAGSSTGPTASGKSAVGVELARRIGRGNRLDGLDGAVPRHGHRHGQAHGRGAPAVPHHLIDVLDPWEEFSLARYVELAGRAAAEIAGRGRQVLFVGGTPLYLKALLAGHLPRTAGRLGAAPPAGRRGPAARRRTGCTGGWPRSIRPRPPGCTPTTPGG